MSKIKTGKKSIKVFAPATVANVASGFDILGFAINFVGDLITVTRTDEKGVRIERVDGISGAAGISVDPEKNTAGVPLLKMIDAFNPDFGLSVKIEKGIPLGSGMGGSAASAVGAAVAANVLFYELSVYKNLLPNDQLIQFALEGEAVASGSKHADNVAPCLHGGFTLSWPGDDPRVVSLPYSEMLYCVLVHPELRIDTKMARSILKKDLSLKSHIQQSARLASLVSGLCTSNDLLIKRGLEDVVIEPQRASLIPGFFEVKKAALDAGVLGCSISGAGPAVFALTADAPTAERAKAVMVRAFKDHGKLDSKAWISKIRKDGASSP